MKLAQIGYSKTRRNQGMALLETIMSVLMLCIFMAGVAALVVQSTKMTDMGRDHYVAATLCKNRLETARTFGFDNITSLRETNFICNANGGQDADGRYNRKTEVTANYLSSTNLAEVKVTVAIKDRTMLVFSNENEIVQSILTRY